MRKRLEVKKGTRFGMLTIIEEVEPYFYKGHPYRQFLCQCDCGKTSIVMLSKLRGGMTKSCGCQSGHRPNHKKISNTRLYTIWSSMKQRCYDSNSVNFHNYGERGILMCDEWRNDFMAFYNWAMANGYKDNLSIDRIDFNGNYEPTNCRWATREEQARNRRNNVVLELNGEKHTISEWSKKTGIRAGTLQQRKYSGWSDEKILTYPLKKHKKYKRKK